MNVSYDPTRELYEQYYVAFGKYWRAKAGQEIKYLAGLLMKVELRRTDNGGLVQTEIRAKLGTNCPCKSAKPSSLAPEPSAFSATTGQISVVVAG